MGLGLDLKSIRIFCRKRAIVSIRFFSTFITGHFWNDFFVEITIIISTALLGVSAMFAFVNCGEVSSVLTKNCFDFHGVGVSYYRPRITGTSTLAGISSVCVRA